MNKTIPNGTKVEVISNDYCYDLYTEMATLLNLNNWKLQRLPYKDRGFGEIISSYEEPAKFPKRVYYGIRFEDGSEFIMDDRGFKVVKYPNSTAYTLTIISDHTPTPGASETTYGFVITNVAGDVVFAVYNKLNRNTAVNCGISKLNELLKEKCTC